MAEPLGDRLALDRVDPAAALTALAAALASTPGVVLRRREPMAAHTPLRCGGPADLWALVADERALAATLDAARQAGVPWRACWPLEDVLVRDGGLRGLVLRPGRGFEGAALLPEDQDGPARLRLGAATPWSAALAALRLARLPGPDAATSPLSTVGAWPGCPGALMHTGDPAGLEGLCHALAWHRGRRIERTVLAQGAAPAALPASALLTHVELPLLAPPGARRLKHRPAPPPPGTLFADDGPLRAGPQLRAAGLLDTRLRAWRLARPEAGTLVNLGGGDFHTAALLAKGVAEHANRIRGIDLVLRIPTIGVDGARKPSVDGTSKHSARRR